MSKIARYWVVIVALLIVVSALYIDHLVRGTTPPREALVIEALDFAIYWYGIWIVGGMILGAYVVAELVRERATAVLQQHVPAAIGHKVVTELALSETAVHVLQRKKIVTIDNLLLHWGQRTIQPSLDEEVRQQIEARLRQLPDISADWLDNPPWRTWNPDHVWNGLIWCLIPAIVGARLYHVLTPSPSMAAVGIYSPLDYFRQPLQVINLRNGGLGIYGGIAGGALGLWLYTRRQRLSPAVWADLAVIGLALGQVFGRWGNFFNQELYGRPSNLPWAVTIDPNHRLPAYSDISRFHPAFLYESLWNLFTFVILLTLLRRGAARLLPGDLTGIYLIFYAVGRILLETVRLDSRTVALGSFSLNLAVATLVSIAVALVMGGWIGWQHWRLPQTYT